ncbi:MULTISPECIES: hypothetical protein [Flavobacterium]|jgi:hypothetical protein|uniref:Uncharacterized protein n=1 Tax=Flavobacterium johnsoniae TaxID=986 RepID=A0A1M5LFI6_FLAJO|nr:MULTISPECIES: hypothetical protein [Flavobacterium]WDF59212.1 hypothetical protein PQ462_21160 [Flavobacterium sp. KACC 22758]SHG63143.1 hypothetical protein SAMN05444388_103427 [Flavobacterium johnsoniae]
MNFNIIGYFIYLIITIFIILKVGKICYKNGNVFVLELIPNHADLCQKINQVLLLAYYLLNIGYCAMTLISWQKIISSTQLIETICIKTAVIIFIISILHYLNILIITKYAQKLIHNNKN